MKNSAYHCPYDLASNKVNAIYYIVYKMRKYDSTGMEHNYLFSCGMGDNPRGICFPKDEKTMGIHGVAGKPTHMDILNFLTSYMNLTGEFFLKLTNSILAWSNLSIPGGMVCGQILLNTINILPLFHYPHRNFDQDAAFKKWVSLNAVLHRVH